ncbi:hemolysin-type calcium-binding region [Nostoc commune NIES-4072]|uniref:Hemolysin-type calcium-binding region n=1 Tax=Nostoc commune NIES-4072 TaxID=2005467 RepID=A0A2R5FKR8_NOSCO|nr:DUF4347 domain-containing protein [Nostoc commune]BBD69636.1 hemolysin-type calcium-binding region [Nostoc commune HK-02]GBG19362.1 hemolysin-type calcium-binding region [Nostoc commune NIES-4072]
MTIITKLQVRSKLTISTAKTHNLVFIDTAVEDYQSLANGVTPNTKVFFITPTQNGIKEITKILAYHGQNLTSIHIVAHGVPGCLYLGNTRLGLDTLNNYQEQLQQWQQLTSKPKFENLLLYSCNLAAGDAGAEFITKLHQLTGLNIAASRERVGTAALGGNWKLEVCTAQMEVSLAFTQTTQQAYTGVFATFTVNSISDEDDGDRNNGITTLREAIKLANNTPSRDTITFAGVFADNTPDTITLTSGQLRITDNLTIQGTGASQLTISGNNTSRAFEISGAGTDVIIDDLKIANAKNLNNTPPGQGGGGIFVNSSSILSLTSSTVSNNTASYGGGISNRGALSLTNSTISGNTGDNGGGGIFNGGTLSLTNSTVFGNKAFSGGGGISNGGTLSLNSSQVFGNTTGYDGGGISNSNIARLRNSTVSNNTADYDGGGIYNYYSGRYEEEGSGYTTLINSTVSGNKSNGSGGGIYNRLALTLLNTTITNNTADSDSDIYGFGNGGGIFNEPIYEYGTGSRITVGNTIIAGNFDNSTTGEVNPDVDGYFIDSGNNLIGKSNGSTYFTTSTLVGTKANPIDPKLGLLQNNGGNTLTHTLQPGSPAINTGSNALTLSKINTDQRGAERIADGIVDIGAVEVQPSTTIAPPTTSKPNGTVVTNTNDSGEGSLRQAILNANANAGEDTITFAGVFSDDTPDIINLTSGQLTITDDLRILGTGTSNLTISGNDDFRVFEIANTGTDAIIDGLKVTNANDVFGAILVNSNATLNLNNSNVSNSIGSVGGIFNRGSLNLTNTTVSDNTGSSVGGGIYNSGSLSLNNSTVANNQTFLDDAPSYGGGIFNTGTLEITNSILSNNGAFTRGVSGNPPESSTYGGSIYNSGIAKVINSTIFGSSAELGGGISNSGSLSLTNTTVSSNIASVGGGISNSGKLTLSNSTITDNAATRLYAPWKSFFQGGGIVNQTNGAVIVANTIIAGNYEDDPYASEDVNSDVIGKFTDSGNNLIGDRTGSTGFTTSTLVGTSDNSIDPKLGPLQNNGGTSLTHALLKDSPAINAGNNALVPKGITTDGRSTGFDRIFNGIVDTGAYEATAVLLNQSPVNTIPNTLSTFYDAYEGTPLIFSSNQGRMFAISDIDAGTNPVQVTLTATNGILTLNNTSGLTFTTGDGIADPTLTFTGTISSINNALDGLSFTATNYRDTGSITITTNDLGNTGPGGAFSDTDTLTNIYLSPNIIDGTYDVDETLIGSDYADRITGVSGDDTIIGNKGDDQINGIFGDNDIIIYNLGDGTDTISYFGGVGTGYNPPSEIIKEVDVIKFNGAGLTARNLLLTQNNRNLEITFEGVADAKIILEDFTLQYLDNLFPTGTRGAVGNILFDGQTSIRDSYDVFDIKSTQRTIFNKNTVTFLNDLNNNVEGFDNSDDVINAQGGNDIIDGKGGNDLLRGGVGLDTLIGGAGDDTLIGNAGNDILTGGSGNDRFVYQTLSDRGWVGDTITDFESSNDQLVLSNLFESLNYSGSNPISDDYLRFVQLGTDTQVQVNSGDSTVDFNTLVTLNTFTATNLVLGTNVIV